MDQVGINGASIVYASIPAGPATRSIAGTGAKSLASNEAASDIINMVGALTGDVTLTIPATAQAPQVVGTNPASPLFTGPVVLSWIKIFQNNTSGAHSVILTNGGASTLTLTNAATQGKSVIVYSPDGINVFACSTPT